MIVLCWFSDLVVTQVDAGSIPVTTPTEGIRLDEDTVLKTAAGETVQGSSPWPSATGNVSARLAVNQLP